MNSTYLNETCLKNIFLGPTEVRQPTGDVQKPETLLLALDPVRPGVPGVTETSVASVASVNPAPGPSHQSKSGFAAALRDLARTAPDPTDHLKLLSGKHHMTTAFHPVVTAVTHDMLPAPVAVPAVPAVTPLISPYHARPGILPPSHGVSVPSLVGQYG